tara:strand:+ start:299 stop:778 length:480 start_codon:yes stop_codon:yes gene_type:complete
MLTVKNPKNFDWENMPLIDCVEGNAKDTYFTLKLFNLIYKKLDELDNLEILEKVLMPSLPVFAEMEWEGLLVDPNQLSVVGKSLSDKNIETEDTLYLCRGVKKTDNLASASDLIEILYTREEALELYPPDKTPKGKPSVSAPTLKILLEHIETELSSRA